MSHVIFVYHEGDEVSLGSPSNGTLPELTLKLALKLATSFYLGGYTYDVTLAGPRLAA